MSSVDYSLHSLGSSCRILDFETVIYQRTIGLRRSDNLHAVEERLNFLFVFIILGYPVEPRRAYARFCRRLKERRKENCYNEKIT